MQRLSTTRLTTPRRARSHPPLLGMAAVIAILATACGGGDAQDVSADVPAPTQEQTAAANPPEPTPSADGAGEPTADVVDEQTEAAAAPQPDAQATEVQDATAADGGAGGGAVTPQALCDALESSGMVEALDLQVISYEAREGGVGLDGCSPAIEGQGTVLSLAIEDPGNYSGATGADLLEAIRSLSDSFLGQGRDLPDLGDGALVYEADADSDPGATVFVRLGDQVISMILDGDDPIEDVIAGMEQVVAALGG